MGASKMRVKRFSVLQRLFHALLMTGFLIQSMTGVARLYMETSFGQGIAWIFGGYDSAKTVHIYVGIALVIGFIGHLFYLFKRIDPKCFRDCISGPNSMLPHKRDLRDFFRHLGWILNLCEAPDFERWTYWEKFDYWAVFWGMVILGGTGLLIAFPVGASNFVPGWGLNVAFWIHRVEAILAMVHVFLIHFFIAHLRPHSFPMDTGMLEGSVPLLKIREEKGGWIKRLEESGTLGNVLVPEAPPFKRVVFYTIGYAAVFIGLFLVVGGVLCSGMITW
jgi:cytochrome b subunit of formate dehydrogenase